MCADKLNGKQHIAALLHYGDLTLVHRGKRHSVYRAFDSKSGNTVALKLLHEESYHFREVSRFQAEYRLLKDHSVPGMVRAFDFEYDGNRPVLSMEYIGSSSLRALIADGPISVDRFLILFLELAQAVNRIHNAGIIHLDLCPSNIVLADDSGAPTIVDFGSASTFTKVDASHFSSASLDRVGNSLHYTSPEQTGRMNCAVDQRSDLYSLGAIFYEMLTGSPPFAYGDPLELVHAHLSLAPTAPHKLNQNVSVKLSELTLKLLAKAPDDRYQTASGLAYDLEYLLTNHGSNRTHSFVLGSHTGVRELSVPEQLHGRSQELALLAESLDHMIAENRAHLLLVSGYSGVGKTALIRSLVEPIARQQCFFLTAKFDQVTRDIPFATIVQAFQEFLQYLLAQPEDQITSWRTALTEALGANAALITCLLPKLDLLLGEQQEGPPRHPTGEKTLFNAVFRQFIKAIVQRQPLVLFLDDWQWADSDSLHLIKSLIVEGNTLNLLVIGAFRDNEVGADHQLTAIVSELMNCHAPVMQIALKPLPPKELNKLVSDVLHGAIKQTAPLTKLVYEKTQGNPFFAIQFLQMLYQEKLLRYDQKQEKWIWDLEPVKSLRYTDNIVDLLLAKVNRLPKKTRETLKIAACLGLSGSLETLAFASESSLTEVEGALSQAVNSGLVVAQQGAYRFLHDRIQQAAYELLAKDERQATHLKIGRLLLSHLSANQVEENIFEVINQLDYGLQIIESDEEKAKVSELYLIAGRRARKATAYQSALKYFVSGQSLLPKDDRSDDYKVSFGLQFHRAECEYLSGASQAAEEHLLSLKSRVRDPIDLATVTCLIVTLYNGIYRVDLAIQAALEYLKKVAIHFSPEPTDEQVKIEWEPALKQLANYSMKELAELPIMTDPLMHATMNVLTGMLPTALFISDNLVDLIVAWMIKLTLAHGYSDGSCFMFAVLGMVIGPRYGNYAEAYKYGQLGFELVEQRALHGFRPAVYMCFGKMISPWRASFRTSHELLTQALQAAIDAGDFQYAAHTRNALIAVMLASGEPLNEIQQQAEEALAFSEKCKSHPASFDIASQMWVTRTLRGLAPPFSPFEGKQSDEDQFEHLINTDARLAYSAFWHWIRKLQVRCLLNEYSSAIEAATRAESLVSRYGMWHEVADYHLYAALARAAQYNDGSLSDKTSCLQVLYAHLEQLKIRADNCQVNFADRAALVAAEIAAIENHDLEAMQLYEKAIGLAHGSGFVHNEALANELAFKFYLSRGLETNARAHLDEAHRCYARWGADAKTSQLERLYPQLNKTAATTASLDITTVFKAAQAIGKEVAFDRLLQTLMQVTMESAGAQQGVLLLQQHDELTVRAYGQTSVHGLTTDPATRQIPVAIQESSLTDFSLVPMSIINFVRRTHETLVLGDVQREPIFGQDPYCKTAGTRSVICLPIVKQSKLLAILYLDNNLAPHVFTQDRIDLLQMLSSQIVTSLENVMLFESLRKNEKQYRLIFEAAAVGKGQIEANTRKFTRVNAKLCEITGYSEAELLTMTPSDLTHPEDRQTDCDLFFRMRNSGSPTYVVQYRYVRKDGQTIWVQLDTVFVRDAAGQVYDSFVVVQDVTARVTAEEALKTLNLELEARVQQRTAELECAKLAAESASRAKSQFVANVSHEIRTPLNAVIGITELLTRTPVSSHQLDLLKTVQDSAGLLLGLISNILDFEKTVAGKTQLEIIDFEPLSLVESSIEMVAQKARQKDIDLVVYVDPLVPNTMTGDPDRIRQILLNLLSNAIKFTDVGQVVLRVTAHLSDTDSAVLNCSVEDTGIGMSKSALESLFSPFTQADSTISRRFGGTGLGLSISKRLMEMMNGKIQVESEEGKGSVFEINIPLQYRTSGPLTNELQKPGQDRLLLVGCSHAQAEVLSSYAKAWGISCETVEDTDQARQTLLKDSSGEEYYRWILIDRALEQELAALRDLTRKGTIFIRLASTKIGTISESPDYEGASIRLAKPLKRSQLQRILCAQLESSDKETYAERCNDVARPWRHDLILVVDDNLLNTKLARLQLKELGYDCDTVNGGTAAIEAVSKTNYSLILMDWQMPDMNGFQTTAHIREMELRKGKYTPIVAMTAQTEGDFRKECIAAGMDDYLSKPVTMQGLSAKISKFFPERESDSFTDPVAAMVKQNIDYHDDIRNRGDFATNIPPSWRDSDK
jgi:PAS domain S-box-containing protein